MKESITEGIAPESGEKRPLKTAAAFTAVGLFMFISSLLAMAIDLPFAFCVTGLAWGSINIALAQIFLGTANLRLIANKRLAMQLEAGENIEHERAQLIDRLAASGALTGVTLPELRQYLESAPDEVAFREPARIPE